MSTLDLLIFGSHPDDAEIGMGGTIARHTGAGLKVGICDLTLAEMSSNGNVESRQQEASLASDILGLTVRTNLRLPDRGLYPVSDQIEAITREIRRHRPRLVFAPYWQDRHPDHVMCSRLVEDAVFNAKLRRYAPDQEPVTVEGLYFYFINDLYEPQLMVDVSDVYDKKIASLRAYRSQFASSGSDVVKTPLNQGYIERVEARDRMLGQKHLIPYAEGFVSKLPQMIQLF